MKKHIVAVAALCLLGSGAALAQDFKAGDLLVRARAVHLDSANKDSTGLNLAVNDKWLPEVDFTYFLSPNLAAELILTVPQKHTLTAGGVPIGSLKHLPTTPWCWDNATLSGAATVLSSKKTWRWPTTAWT
jgi:outer membrane protein